MNVCGGGFCRSSTFPSAFARCCTSEPKHPHRPAAPPASGTACAGRHWRRTHSGSSGGIVRRCHWSAGSWSWCGCARCSQIQVQRELVALAVATILAAPVGQDSQQWHAVLLEERQHPVVEHVGCGDRVLAIIELDQRYLAVGVDEGLLVDAAHALEVAHVVGVLRTKVPRVLGLDLSVRLLLLPAPSSART